MASNTNNPFGFKMHGLYGDQVTPSAGLITLKVASTDTSANFGEGDPLKFLNTGYVTAFTKGTAVSQLAGIFKSCSYYSTSQGRKVWRNYWPAADATGDISVAVQACSGGLAPRFLVQSAGAVAVGFGDLWATVDIASGTATTGSATGGLYRSACTIDTVGNFGTTATLPWRIVDLYSNIAAPGTAGTDTATSYNWVLVEANNMQATGL